MAGCVREVAGGGRTLAARSLLMALLTSLLLPIAVGHWAPAAGAATGPYPAAVLAGGPAGYWRLGEASGTVAADSSGNGRSGTYSGTLGRAVVGALPADSDGATTFDGASGQVSVANAAALQLNGAFTIELWARQARFANTWPGLLGKGNAATANGYLLYADSAGRVKLKRNGLEVPSSPGALGSTRFSHLTVTYDGATVRWYVDGRTDTTASLTFPTNGGTAPLLLGKADQYGANTIDEVALYNRALAPSEVANHYLSGIVAAPGSATTLVAAGDVACAASDPNFSGADPATCQAWSTARLIATVAPNAIAPLGDLVYGDRSVNDFATSYARSWGALPSSIAVHPAPGNHDYGGSHASITSASVAPGYFGYLGAAVANPAGAIAPNGQPAGWYSYDLGGWHIVSLNHECAAVGGCATGSPQDQWLAADLAAHPAACTLAVGHEPRWSDAGDEPEYQAIWARLAQAKVTMLLSGHDHNYQRFAPRDASGAPSSTGVVQFVVGAGGNSLEGFGPNPTGTAARDASHFGVLRLTLRSGAYDWAYLATDGTTLDAGSAACAGSSAPSYPSTVLADGPVAYWRLGEATGATTAVDASGNGRTGTYSAGGVTLGSAGALATGGNTAAAFNGAGGVVTVADAAPLRLNGPFTFEVWAKLSSFVNTWPGLLLKGDANTANGFLIYYDSTGRLSFKRNGVEVTTSPGRLSTSRFTHLALTYDGSVVRWYADGVLDTATAVVYPTSAGTASLSLGRGDQYGAQVLDEVAIYPTALSAATVADHYLRGTS